MRRHNKPTQEQPKLKDEGIVILKLIIKVIIFGMIFYPMLGAIYSYIINNDLSAWVYYTEYISGTLMLITGFFFSLNFLVARSVFMGEMSRRAWTNSKPMDPESTYRDFRSFLNPGKMLLYLFFGSVVSFIFVISVF